MKEQQNDEGYGLFVGVDPGEKLGYCVLLVPTASPDPIGGAKWITSGTINGTPPRVGETRDSAYARHFSLMRDTWQAVRINSDYRTPTFVVERPSDGQDKWKGKHGAASRATKFTLGMRYGFVVAAAYSVGALEIFSYPVTTKRGERGWYPTERTRNLVHPMRGELVERMLRSRIAEVRIRTGSLDNGGGLSRDEVMSFGVLAYHLETGRHS